MRQTKNNFKKYVHMKLKFQKIFLSALDILVREDSDLRDWDTKYMP